MGASKVKKSFAWSLLEQFSVKAIQLIVQIVLARMLAPELFGILAILLVVISIADLLAQGGLGAALIQDASADDDSFSTAFWLSLALAIMFYLVIYAASSPIAQFYGMENLDVYLRAMSIIVILNAANSIQRTYLQKAMDFRLLFITNFIGAFLSGAFGIMLAFLGFGMWSLIAQAIAQGVLTFVMLLAVVPWKPRMTFVPAKAGSMFSFGWKMCATGILNVLYNNISELIIGKTCSASQLGYYSQGRKWPVAAIGAGGNALSNVLFPALSNLKNDRDAFVAAIKRSIACGTFIIAPLAMGMAAIGEPLIAVLMTEKWIPCVPVFQVTCLSYTLLMLELVSFRAYLALGDSGVYLKLHIIRIVLGIIIIGGAAIYFRDIYAIAIVSAVFIALTIVVIDLQPAKRMFGFGRGAQLRLVLPVLCCALFASLCAFGINFIDMAYGWKLLFEVLVMFAAYMIPARAFRIPGYSDCMKTVKDLAGAKKD